MDFDFATIISNLPVFFRGAVATLCVSLAAITVGMVGGMLVCLVGISSHKILKLGAKLYISVFRGIPILVLLLIVYYILPEIGIETPPLIAAITGLALNTTAFQAEIYRGGFASIPHGQIEAARALGIGPLRLYRKILIPQVMKKVMPSLINEIIILLKNSSLISAIAVTELMRVSQTLVASTYRPMEIYMTTAAFYLVMTMAIAAVGSAFSRKMAVAG
ncbi:amino acid ABC transporter permease [Desulfogranum marinum]|uniref:amino acid ABC transporter permease n=1 Tax=Desulfogranum marinum TaxID=453220 RepID=UPI0029C79CEC|nr:amino acid ABC transporter permease [Desulfogranum marinum]